MKILVSDPVSEQGVAILREHFAVDVKTKLPEAELIALIPEYDGLVVRSETKVTEAVIQAAKRLRIIGRAGVGVDNIDVEAATHKGIMVINAPEGNTVAATEHTMAMMLALARNVPQGHGGMRQGQWLRGSLMGVELRGKTLGIIGLGRIGSGVAKRALAMEMDVVAYDPFISTEQAEVLGVKLTELEDLYPQSDFITVHMPLTPDTKNLLYKDTFARMKPGVRIINCARGGIIHEGDLAEALASGQVAGAAVDVFSKEPAAVDNPLLQADNIILTPHLGASTAEAQVGVAVDVAHGIVAALKGQPVATAVNMAAVPNHVMEVIQPYFPLAENMGRLAIHLAAGRTQGVEVEYAGDIAQVDTKMLTTAVVKGLLAAILTENVNYVNAPAIAKARGIKVREVRSGEKTSFADLIRVTLRTDQGIHQVDGTLFGKTEGRIVAIDGYRVDVDPRGWLLIGPHSNRPGIVGKVGTILGNDGINIHSMQVGRTETEGTNIMVIGVDGQVPEEAMDRIRQVEGIMDSRLIHFAGTEG